MVDEPPRLRDRCAQRPVPGDDQGQTARRLDELEHALLLREPAGVEDLGRVGLLTDLRREVDAARDDADRAGAEELAPSARAPSTRR